MLWEVIRRIWQERRRHQRAATPSTRRCRTNLTVVSVYGGDDTTIGTYTLDPTTHSVTKREMGVFEYKGGKVTPKAFFGIGGADYKKA